MRKQTFLKLCGERDQTLALGEAEPTPDDLFRLERIAELLDCPEVGLEMYLTRCRRFPEWVPPLPQDGAWCVGFLRDAPGESARERIHGHFNAACAIDFPPSTAYNESIP